MASLKLHRWGNPTATAWLCLHGFMGTGSDWDTFACAALALNPNLSILAPDLPGHGESSSVDVDLFESQIFALLDVENLGPVTLIGYSLGGRLGLQTILSDPQRFPAFVGISTSAGLDIQSERDQRKDLDCQLATRLKGITTESAFRQFLSDWWELPVFKSQDRSLEMKSSFIESRMKQTPQTLAESLMRWSPGVLPSLWDSLGEFHGRSLFLAGADDEKYAQISKKLAAKIPDARFQILAAAGHQILIEKPLEAARCVVDFLQHRS
jgi:2-succinyl-6-hydroxy-2,4-cyclohexadiene-1-carboxylate synthase